MGRLHLLVFAYIEPSPNVTKIRAYGLVAAPGGCGHAFAIGASHHYDYPYAGVGRRENLYFSVHYPVG